DPSVDAPVDADTIDIQIQHDGGYTAVIQTGNRVRQISDPGPTCAGLADALALTVAILLDVSERAPPPNPPPPAASSRAPTTPADSRAYRPRSGAATVLPRASASFSGGISAGVVETAPVFELGGDLRLASRIGVGASALWIPTQGISYAQHEVDVWLAAATLR